MLDTSWYTQGKQPDNAFKPSIHSELGSNLNRRRHAAEPHTETPRDSRIPSSFQVVISVLIIHVCLVCTMHSPYM